MSNYRMSKGTTEHFTSLEEMRTAWGMKPVTKKTSDKKKLKEQQERYIYQVNCQAQISLPSAQPFFQHTWNHNYRQQQNRHGNVYVQKSWNRM